jgi:hypothetical protein
MSEYNKFVQLHYASAPGNDSKEKFKSIALMWRDHKAKHGIQPRSHKKGKRGGAMVAGSTDNGGSIFGDIIPFGNMLGLGMKKPRKSKKGGSMVAGSADNGGSLLGDIIPFGNMLGLGMKKPRKSRRGGAMVAGSASDSDSDVAGSFLDDVVGTVKNFSKFAPMIGLGINEDTGKAPQGGVMSSETYERVRKALLKEVNKKDFKKKLHAHFKAKGMGGNVLDDAVNGFKTGFAMPFNALASLF